MRKAPQGNKLITQVLLATHQTDLLIVKHICSRITDILSFFFSMLPLSTHLLFGIAIRVCQDRTPF